MHRLELNRHVVILCRGGSVQSQRFDRTCTRAASSKSKFDPNLSSGKGKKEIYDFFVDRFVASVPASAVAVAARVLFWPTLWWNQFAHGRNRFCAGGGLKGDKTRWYDEVAPGLVLGALPDAALARHLADEGVTAVVNMVAEWEGPVAFYKSAGIEQLWMPIVDFTSPTAGQLDSAVSWIAEKTSAGGRVYLHCKAGKGRSGTVALAYLISVESLTPNEAQVKLAERRPQVLKSLYKRQEIEEFWRLHKLRKGL